MCSASPQCAIKTTNNYVLTYLKPKFVILSLIILQASALKLSQHGIHKNSWSALEISFVVSNWPGTIIPTTQTFFVRHFFGKMLKNCAHCDLDENVLIDS